MSLDEEVVVSHALPVAEHIAHHSSWNSPVGVIIIDAHVPFAVGDGPVYRRLDPGGADVSVLAHSSSVIGKVPSGIVATASEFITSCSIGPAGGYPGRNLVGYFISGSERRVYKTERACLH